MKLSVPNLSPAVRDEHLLHTLFWRKWPEAAWEDDEPVDDLIEFSFASKSLSDLVVGEKRFLYCQNRSLFDAHYYSPLEQHPELFKVFADLDGSEEAFAEFAADFGGLGVHVLTEGGELKEPLIAWKMTWADVSECSHILDLVQRTRIDELRDLIWIGDENIRVDHLKRDFPLPNVRGGRVLAGRVANPLPVRPDIWAAVHAARGEAARLRLAARFWVQVRANNWMSGGFFDEVRVVSRVIADERGHWRLRSSPNNLAATLWLQVARALEGDVAHRQCANAKCRKWFVISSDRKAGKRSDAKYCGDPKCRKEAFREKRLSGQANRMRKAIDPVRQPTQGRTRR
jgi:hypothetical protein